MTKTTRSRRLLAMLVSIAVLATCLAVAGIHVSAAATVWDFENDTVNGSNLSLYTADSITVSTEKNHTDGGGKSAKFVTDQTAGGARAQMFVQDGNGNIVTVAKDEILTVSIWVYVPNQEDFVNAPASGDRNALRLWLTAGDGTTAYANGAAKDAEMIYEDTANSGVIRNIPVDTWHKITVTTNGAHAGKLRMGLCASNQGKEITFYADDITVERDDPVPAPPITGTAYNYKFDVNNGLYYDSSAKTSSYFKNSDFSTAHNQGNGNGAVTQIVADGSGYGIELSYNQNRSDTADLQRYAGFTLPNIHAEEKNGRAYGKTIHLEVGASFQVTVKYKVTGYASPATLYAAVYEGTFCGLSSDKAFTSHYKTNAALTRITGTTGEQTASAVITPTNKDAFTILLKMDDDTLRAGTKVVITEVDIQPIAAGTIHFDTKGGNAIASVSGPVGDAVTMPADPTRPGYIFTGWTRADGKALPTTFAAGEVTLVANWLSASAQVMDAEDLTVDAPIQLNTVANNVAAASTDYNNTLNGSKSIKVTGTLNSRERTQFFVKAAGQQVVLEKDKNYVLSFRYYIPDTAPNFKLKYWFAAGNSTAPYSNSDDTTFFNERIAVSDKTIDAPVKGAWTQVTIEVNGNVCAGNLRIGVCGDSNPYTLYLDDIYAYEVAPFVSDANTMDFENATLGANLNMCAYNNTTTGVNQAITITDAFNHTEEGSLSAKFTPSSQGGGTRPQMMVKNGAGEQVMVETGKTYEFTFWFYMENTEGNYGMSYWWAATDNETAFATGTDKDAAKIYEASVRSESSKGKWNKVTVTMESNRTGKLRLGICGEDSNSKVRTFYVDDIFVKEVVPFVQDADTESFESYAPGTKLSLDGTGSSIEVSGAYNHSPNGAQSALVTSMTKAGGPRAQMMVKNGAGEQVMITKGKNYAVSFKYFIPEGQDDFNVNYWFTATEGETAFTAGAQKDAAVIYEYTAASGKAADQKGEWITVNANIINAAYDGKLRIGLATSKEGEAQYYIDDLKVVEAASGGGTIDPNATVMDFENYLDGMVMDNYVKGSGTVSNLYNHTKGGKNSLAVTKLTNAGLDRTQMILLNPATGKPYEFKVGESYLISMWVYAPIDVGDLNCFNMWMLGVNDLTEVTNKNSAEYDMGTWNISAPCDEWYEVSTTITIKNGKYLILGLTNHSPDAGYGSVFYVDDIKVEAPKYMTVKFDTNGSKDVIDPIRAVVGLPIPFEADDPYLEGYKFTGWFTDKSCEPKYFYDIEFDNLAGKDGDVLTLYAGWEKWEIFEDNSEIKELEDKYEIKYTEEQVWVDRDPVILDLGDAPEAEVETIVDQLDDSKKDDKTSAQEGLPTWLLIVIIIGGVLVVGGGAAVALIMSKKNKKSPETEA